MKLIVAGATGFVGSEVLYAALQHPSVTSVVSLSRRAVVDPRVTNDPKWESVVLEDFELYPPDVMARMQGAVGCIWAIGGLAKKFSTYEMLHKTNVVYPLAAARKFADALSFNTESAGQFRFVYTSGALAERDQQKQLWTMRDSRLVKGEAEAALLDVAKMMPGSFETVIARPAFILGKADVKSYLLGLTGQTQTIPVHDLASVLVDMAVNGMQVLGGQDTADHLTLVHRAAELKKI